MDLERLGEGRCESHAWIQAGIGILKDHLQLCAELAPTDPAYRGQCAGGVQERDGAYHQGTVWPWLLGAFVEAWLRQRRFAPEAKREADKRFLAPLRAHLGVAGIGHVSEIVDGDPPHTPRGCPFQAWSLGELLRVSRMVEESHE